jgi:hypothetical protein
LIRIELSKDDDFTKLRSQIEINRKMKFVGISAFAYALDFALWILKIQLPYVLSDFVTEFPTPSVSALRGACDAICGLPYLESLFQQHRFTSTRESSRRCFDVCFISELLANILGNKMDDRIVYFVIESKGVDLEWTLGFYLKHHVATNSSFGSYPVISKQNTGSSEEL